MKVSEESLTWLGRIAMAITGFFIVRGVARIFKGPDGKFSQAEFGKFIGFWFFLSAATYVLIREGERPSGTEHIFSETWLFLIFTALLSVLHLDHIIDKFMKVLEMLIRIKTKTVPPPTEEEAQ